VAKANLDPRFVRCAALVGLLLAGCGAESSSSSPDGGQAPGDGAVPDSASDGATSPEASADSGRGPGDGAAPDGDSGASAGGIFAAPGGSGAACTFAAPCTLDGAAAKARTLNSALTADLVVTLRGGTYRLSAPFALGPQDSGSGGHQVVYRAYPGEVPILSGATQVTGFVQYDASRNVWRAAAPTGATGRQLFVDGVRAQRARSLGAPPAVAATATGFTTSDGTYASFQNATSIEIAQDNEWKHMGCPLQGVASAAGGGSSFTVQASCWAANHVNVPNVGFPFNGSGLPGLSGISWVENAYELLTQPGQFYLDAAAGYLYVIPLPGVDLATADVELPALEELLDVSGTPAHLAPVDDTDSAAVYAGSWTSLTGRGLGDLGDDVHASQTAGDSVTYSFDGTGLEVLGETNTDEGAFTAYVDGVQDTRQTFTEAAPVRAAQVVVYSVQGLSKGMHSVRLVNAGAAGSYTIVDGFVVVPEAIAPAHDIAFERITFSFATWNLPTTTGYIDNQAGVMWNGSGPSPTPFRIPAAVQVHRGQSIAFRGDTFEHLGGAGVDLADGTQGSSLVGCAVDDTSGGGVSVGEVDDYFQTEASLMTSGDTVSDNGISFVGRDYHDAVGVWAGYTRGLTIAHNDIGHTPYSGVSLGWGWGWASSCTLQGAQPGTCRTGPIYAGDNQILGNYIHDVMTTLFDGGPIYTNGGQGNGTGAVRSVLTGNFVTGGNHTNNMLYHDEGSSYWDTHDNVTSLGGSDWVGMWIGTIHDITIGPVNFTDNANANNNGTNITFAAPTVVSGGNWPAAALSIMAAAGLEASYRTVPSVVDDDDQAFAFAGTWGTSGARGYGDFDDNVHYTTTSGDVATLTFTGVAATLLGEKNPDQGTIEVLVDGQSRAMVDTSLPAGSPRQAQQVLFSSGLLTAGSHTLAIANRSGATMTVDAVRVQPM
jgi:hypothetical protein